MATATRILIVGAGIAGLALGRALRRRGFIPEIIERAASWTAGGTGLYLPGNGVRALGALGLADELSARAVRMSHQRILDHGGRQLAEIELSTLWNPVGLCVGIARSELHRILLDGASGVPMRLGTTVTALRQDNDQVDVDTGVQGRVVLIADAAHATSPNMAEGASMALEDALVLARMMATHGSTAQALSAFTERRRARIRWVRERTHRRDRIRTLPVPLRNLSLRLAGTALYRRDYRPLFEKP